VLFLLATDNIIPSVFTFESSEVETCHGIIILLNATTFYQFSYYRFLSHSVILHTCISVKHEMMYNSVQNWPEMPLQSKLWLWGCGAWDGL